MKQWEYKTVTVIYNAGKRMDDDAWTLQITGLLKYELDEGLEKLGKQHWELVAINKWPDIGVPMWKYIFKREIVRQ